MADEMTTERAQAASTDKSTTAHAAAVVQQHPSMTPLVPEQQESQLPDGHDSTPVLDEAQNHGVPPPPDGNARDSCDAPQIRAVTFQAMSEAADPAGFFPPVNDESAEHAATAGSMLAANDVVVLRSPDLFPSEQEEFFPEHEAVRSADDEGEGRHGGLATSPLVEYVAELGALIHRVAELDGYDNMQSRAFVVHALESAQLPGFRRRRRQESALAGIIVTAADQFGLALMADMFRNGGFRGFPSDRNGIAFDELPSYRNGGFGAVPASAAAVATLEKRTFHAAGLGGCAICLDEEFEEGQELSVMPCSHAFHTQCINAWLGQSNMCPLCRHALPTSED
ncbi:hypothetical protein EJB05_29498, partial [Eragrostis curvula]